MRSTDFPFAVMPQRLQRGGSAEEQRRAKQRSALERMLEGPEYLRRGVGDAFETVKGYVGSRAARPSAIPGDVKNVGSMMYEAVAEDPSGFAMDALLAPLSGMRDFADVRQQAREARAAGDNETASMLEQAAVAAALSAIPVAGPLIARGARGARRLAAKPNIPSAEPPPRAFTVTPEETPGKSTAHRADVQSGSKQARARYQGAAPWQRNRQDVLYAARDVPTGTQTGTGAYINSAGELELNPVNLTALRAPDIEGRLPEIEAIEKLRGVIDAQEAMAGNMPVPSPEGNALFFNMGRPPSEQEMAFLAQKTPGGFGTTATTGGAMTFPFDSGMAGAEAQAAMSDWRDLAGRYLRTEPEAARNTGFYTPAMGRFDDDYNVVPTEPFSGEATMSVLEDFAKLDPSVAQSLAASPDVRDVLREKYLRDEGAPSARGDIQNTRQFFADPRWAQAVELIRQGMPPAAALAALGYSASALAGETPE
jgi:hypothetical protein